MSRVDLSFGSMGTEARVRLECESLSAAELEGYAAVVRAVLEDVERALSRFRPESELCAVNRDPRSVVPVSPLLAELARAASWARSRSGGLVDATLLGELEEAGYASSRAGVAPARLDEALRAAPPRRPARRRAGAAALRVDAAGRLHRAPGVRLDSGGLGKGLAADLAAALMPSDVRYAISCGGDLAVGGPGGAWEVAVAGVRTGAEATRLRVRGGGVATSGIHARLWQRADGGFAHHVLDPSTGRPAWTGLVAVTAVAPSAVEVEVLASWNASRSSVRSSAPAAVAVTSASDSGTCSPRRRRSTLTDSLWAMRNSHGRTGASGSRRRSAASARSIVFCSASLASSGSEVIERQ